MKGFDIRNFVLLSQALKELPKKKRTSYSLIGAIGAGGLGGVVPAFALGKAEIAKTSEKNAVTKAADLAAENVEQKEMFQEIYKEVALALDANNAQATKQAIIDTTVEERNSLALLPVRDGTGTVILPGATITKPDVPIGNLTAAEFASIGKEIATAFGAAIKDVTTEPD